MEHQAVMKRNITRICGIILAVGLMLSLLLGTAAAESGTGDVFVPGEEGQAVSDGGLSNEEAMRGYVQRELNAAKRGNLRLDGTAVRDRLSGPNLRMYRYLREQVEKIAAGEETTAIYRIPVTAVNQKISFTAKDLGVSSITNRDGSLNQDAYEAFISEVKADFTLVVPALLSDCPYDLYWYDKTIGYHYTYPGFMFGRDRIYYEQNAVFEIQMTVAQEYAAWGRERSYETNPTRVKAVKTAVNNAKKIVKENAGKSDVAIMKAYKDTICDLTTYNDEAVEDPSRAYGNPWQLIWVFDGDQATNVVCEGYAKAFQYLCDLTEFKTAIQVTTVTGWSNGNHMWNMVRMPDGKRYLVDVTNCDRGQVGYPDYLFLAGYSAVFDYEGRKEYCYSCGAWDSCYYIFETEPKELYAVESENLSTKAYSEITVGNGIYSLNEKAKTAKLIDAAEPNIKTLTVEDTVEQNGKTYKVTAIAEGAMREQRKLTQVTIGKNVTAIGKDAFRSCVKLASVTFAGKKVTKIGANAFTNIQKKAKFYLPEKVFDTYRKLIKAAGAPEKCKYKTGK